MKEAEKKAAEYYLSLSVVKKTIEDIKKDLKTADIFALEKKESSFININELKKSIAPENVCVIKDFGKLFFLKDKNDNIVIPVRKTNRYDLDNVFSFINKFGEEEYYSIASFSLKSWTEIKKIFKNEDIEEIQDKIGNFNEVETVMPKSSLIKKEIKIPNIECNSYKKAYFLKNEYESKYKMAKEKLFFCDDLTFFIIQNRKNFKLNESFKEKQYETLLNEIARTFNNKNPQKLLSALFRSKVSSKKIKDFLKDNDISDKELNDIGIVKNNIYTFLQPVDLNASESIENFVKTVEMMKDVKNKKSINFNSANPVFHIPKFKIN